MNFLAYKPKMMKKSKLTKVAIIAFMMIGVVGIMMFGGIAGAGNYGYAQQYEFKTDKKELIRKVEKFVSQHAQYKVPDNIGLENSLDSLGDVYNAYLYYPEENSIVHFLIFDNDEDVNTTSIYLDAINEGVSLGHWKVVNRDYNRKENKHIKSIFEKRVLDKLNLPYQNKGNGMFVFWK